MLADDGLADRIRRGDPDAFRAFFANCSGPLLGYLAGMVGDRALAEDSLQETMLRVFRNIERYQERGAFRAWVFRIASHLALTELRRRGLAVTSPLDDRTLELPDPSLPDPGRASRPRSASGSSRLGHKRCPMSSARCCCCASARTWT